MYISARNGFHRTKREGMEPLPYSHINYYFEIRRDVGDAVPYTIKYDILFNCPVILNRLCL